MSEVRKKGILTIIYIYIGFIFGAVNTYLFSRYFAMEQYGLTRVFLDMATLFGSVAALATPTLLTKFYPYYRDRLNFLRIDLVMLALAISTVGLLLLTGALVAFKPLIIRKFSGRSPLLVDYFYLVIPFTIFLVYFNVLEAHAWNYFRTVATNFFKDVFFRAGNLLLILAFMFRLISFHTFMILYSCLYVLCFFGLLGFLIYKKELPVSFSISPLTRRLWKKMVPYVVFILGGNIVAMLSQTIDTIIISSVRGLEYAAIFALANYLTAIIIVPQRSVIGLAFPIISRAWKDKDMNKIAEVYRKTSINLLLISTFMFSIIWINFDDALTVLKLDPMYREGKPALLFLALAKIVELGTGVNGQIIITSRKWKFELYSNMLLLLMTIPVNYLLIKHYGLIGAGIATFTSMTVFNLIRFGYLLKTYRLQPFTIKTLWALVLPLALYFGVTYLIVTPSPWLNMILRSLVFVILYGLVILRLQLSNDVVQVFHTVMGRLNRFRRP